ncbi:MAG: hypothetical protein L6V81_02020 [Clostridium sp.]|nr:MAG: hypothetical protein L6V81_02020 [Clostridium sp.]
MLSELGSIMSVIYIGGVPGTGKNFICYLFNDEKNLDMKNNFFKRLFFT